MTPKSWDRLLNDSEPNPTFFLGVGSQKAGTTWLHRTLQSHPEVETGGWKEYAFWDTYFLGDKSNRRLNFEERQQELTKELQLGSNSIATAKKEGMLQGLTLALELMGEPDAYISHFLELSQGEGVRVVGDLTPSYALLNEENFIEIRQRLTESGFVVMPIFVMRDPLDRMTSAFNMMIRQSSKKGVEWRPVNADEEFWRFCHLSGSRLRTQYEFTVRALDGAFGHGNVHYSFFESLFQQSKVNKIFASLGVAPARVNGGKVVNSSPKRFLPSTDVGQQFYEEFDETYSFCLDRFPGSWEVDSWVQRFR